MQEDPVSLHGLPASRVEALRLGYKRYYTGKPCKHGHVTTRRVRGGCDECNRQRARAYAAQHRQHYRDLSRNWSQKNPDRRREHRRKWQREVRSSAQRRCDKARYRAAKKNRVPVWVDHSAIRQVYEERERIEQETGIKHHVDHVLPLKGKHVSGLHVAQNLRVEPALYNKRKGNRYVPK